MTDKKAPDQDTKVDLTTLVEGEIHPSAHGAYVWFQKMIVSDPVNYVLMRETLMQTAIDGDRLSQISIGTLSRLEKGEPVSDRYLLGLCWFLRDWVEGRPNEPEKQPKSKKGKKKGKGDRGKSLSNHVN